MQHKKIFTKNDINFSSLTRYFVDDTTQYDSPILVELDYIDNLLKTLKGAGNAR